MKINPKNGIEKLIFGMKQNDVTALYGKPDRNYKDEDDNVIFAYNKLKMRLTFYVEEEFKLGYIVASSADLELFGHKIINRKISDVKKDLAAKAITKFTQEEFDTFENYFNEENQDGRKVRTPLEYAKFVSHQQINPAIFKNNLTL